ncbi:DUF6753 family protein [uncultured Variovorax sp.]|jgi:hypothetical protein|uniref:DUF6753 family protein n=1 Tax=uncultured Variovorax sp. TaxID=114708 RepID=UPI002607FD24|nr:DUF6753 family protein [uncultured Variovorax sp.]
MKPGIVEVMERLRGRELTDEEAGRLLHMQNLLGIDTNDALWVVMVALEHYQQLYEAMPRRIAAAGEMAVKQVKETADAVAAAAAASAQDDLSRELARSVKEVASQTARKQQWQWVAAGLTVAAVSTASAGWMGFARGHEAGLALGYQEARNESAAAAWGATPDGRLAYRMANVGSLQQVARCTQPGWQVSDGVCFPKPAGDGNLYGWRLPK